MDGSPSPPRDAPDPGPSELQRHWTMWGFGGLLGTLASTLISPPPTGSPAEEPLPWLSDYNAMVLRPCMSRQEELLLKQQLLTALQQVQFAVKGMDMKPVELPDLKTSQDGISRSNVVEVQPVFRRRVRWFRMNTALAGEGLDKKDEYEKLIQVIEKYSKQIKVKIGLQLDSQGCTEDFAREICSLVECMEKNLKLTVQSGGSAFTLAGLIRLIKVPNQASALVHDVRDFRQFAIHVATFVDRAIRSIGTTPVHFKRFGKEASCLLHEDFTFDKLKLNSDVFKNLSIAIGGQKGDRQAIRQLMVKSKERKHTFSFNLRTTEYDAFTNPDVPGITIQHDDEVALFARLCLNKPFGKDFKSVFQMAYPTYQGKFEIRGRQPYVSYGGCLELKANPVNVHLNPQPILDISAVFGMKYVGFGSQLEYNFGAGQMNAAVGMSLRTKLSAFELSYKFRPGVVRATVLKKLVNTSTTLALDASYSQENGENGGASLTVGYKHAVDPTLYYKAKIGTAGASLAVKKSSVGVGTWCVKAAGHVPLNDRWRMPKVGLTLSCRS